MKRQQVRITYIKLILGMKVEHKIKEVMKERKKKNLVEALELYARVNSDEMRDRIAN